MADEFDTDQLVEFCQRLGLAKDGYLDEKELAIVCNCIGLQAPEEMMKELFEELDTDKDGRVCLEELSQMLRGMPKNPPSPEKLKKFGDASNALSSSPLMGSPAKKMLFADFTSAVSESRGAFSILDPHNSGFTKVGQVLDMWSQLGISAEDGIRILKDMGFSSGSRTNSLNVQDFNKAMEDETDNMKDAIPLLVQTALITYRTETQYLRSVCESMECERDKLKSDVLEAHQRSSLLAQEVDEQNSRLEKNSQMLIQKMESKYSEQIHELQQKFLSEKESLQQALMLAEAQLSTLQENDAKLKSQILKLNNENSSLEKELQNLNNEIRSLNRTKIQLEKKISRYVDLENKLLEMERKNVEILTDNEAKLGKAFAELQYLRDQNDELTVQLEKSKESVKLSQGKRLTTNKKRKGSRVSSMSDGIERMEECHDSPLEKIGKFHSDFEMNIYADDPEELESSIDASCSQPDSGNFPAPVAISLAACMGESSTDSPQSCPEDFRSRPNHVVCVPLLNGKSDPEYETLEIEMDTVKEKIATIISEKQHLLEENLTLKSELYLHVDNRQDDMPASLPIEMVHSPNFKRVQCTDASSQTSTEQLEVPVSSPTDSELIKQLRERIFELESESMRTKADFENERKELKDQCADLESSLDLLRVEYEKCEDYWHDKLQEARDLYDQDRAASDEKLHDLIQKIKEYDEAFMPMMQYDKLPPIEERASLERQVTDLEEECEGLRQELNSIRIDQDTAITSYHKQLEMRMTEECSRLEQQVSALTMKCKDYESRLSSLAEEEQSTLEESGMMDMLKDRVRQLEFQMKNQEDKYKYQVMQLEQTCKEKDEQLRLAVVEVTKSSPSPQPPPQIWKEEVDPRDNKSKSLLEMLHQSNVDVMSIWPQRYANQDKSSSLPFIPVSEQPYAYTTGGWGALNNAYPQDIWGPPMPPLAPQGKKAWCHVELGWLQALRAKLKQREDQCFALQRALQQKERDTDKLFSELRYKHDAETANWEGLMHASQELVRQQALKHKEQAEKLAHSELLMKDLWVENSKLMAALSSTEQRVMHLENLLKYQMENNSASIQQTKNSSNQMPSPSPRSLQFHPHNFST